MKSKDGSSRGTRTGFVAVLLAASAIAAAGPVHASERKPNVLYIVADDLGWKDVGYHGSDIATPTLDRLAATGARLEQFYVQPMCTPTRACLMTGRYPFRYGLQTLVIPSASTYGLPTDEWLLPQALKEAGYTTALVGKWHLGHGDKAFWPKQRGFDHQYGPLIGELDYFTHEQHGVVDWFRDNEQLVEPGYTTTLLGDRAVALIEAHDAAKPLYLYLAFNAPHTPYQAPQEYLDRYAHVADESRRAYAGSITAMDDQIARVLAALEAKRMRDDTLVVFHSDNGGTRNAMFAGEGDMSKTKIPCDNGPYRDGKASLYEGGTRVCAIANWPGRIAPGVREQVLHVVDMYPTIAALAGASTAKCKPLDGLDVWKTLGEGKPSPRTEVVYNIEPFRGGVRQGDWKLIWRAPLPSSVELYDVTKDPSEKTDLAAANPAKVLELQQRIQELAKQSAKALFLVDQFQAFQAGMKRPPAMPNEDAYFEGEYP